MFPVGGDNEERDGGVYTGGPVGGHTHKYLSLSSPLIKEMDI